MASASTSASATRRWRQLVDHIGARAVVSAGGLLVGISWIGAGLAGSLSGLYLFYALGGVGAGAVYGASIGCDLAAAGLGVLWLKPLVLRQVAHVPAESKPAAAQAA